MQIREYSLPAGWFPRNPDEITDFLAVLASSGRQARAAVSPHAGWFYSGRIAALGVSSLDPQADTVVVIGGHLAEGSPALFAMEDAVRTPFGPMPIDAELRELLISRLGGVEDEYRDNTVEVLLPMVRYFFPGSKLVWVRFPAEKTSFEAGKEISRQAAALNRKINVLGSTDLTHYGRNYGFMPQGTGAEALRWMREVNDAAFIRAVEEGNTEEVLRCAEKDFSSCSAGAVLGAMGFAQEEKLEKARLLEYGTSADMQEGEVPSSFVGYASFAFDKPNG
jgi:AmmeMemoRadiSam system protein B